MLRTALLLVLALALALGCRDVAQDPDPDARLADARLADAPLGDAPLADAPPDARPSADARPPDARGPDAPPGADAGGLVPAIGTAATVDVVCWNVRRFPSTSQTPAVLASLITSLDVDVVGLAEIDDDAAFADLASRLPGWQSFLGEGDGFIKMALLWRTAQITVTSPGIIFDNDFDFPRPPLVATLSKGSDTMTLVVLHHKAGREDADETRRRNANTKLAGWLDDQGNPKALLCGDFNEDLDAAVAPEVYGAWLAEPATYRILTAALDHGGATTFLPNPGAMLDQMIATAALDGEIGAQAAFIPQLQQQLAGYVTTISDHLPVALRLDLH